MIDGKNTRPREVESDWEDIKNVKCTQNIYFSTIYINKWLTIWQLTILIKDDTFSNQ